MITATTFHTLCQEINKRVEEQQKNGGEAFLTGEEERLGELLSTMSALTSSHSCCILVAFPESAFVPIVALSPGSHAVCDQSPGAEGCSPKNWDCRSQVLRYEAVRVSTLLVMVTVGA